MSTRKDSLKFTMTSRALKLLGQNLYARPWSAVSELVANGIDAGATTIYVSMTEDPATNTGTLEVLDNGSGMTEEDGLRVKMCVWLGVSRGLDLAFLNAD